MLLKYWGTNLVRSVRNRGLENAIKNKTDKKKKKSSKCHTLELHLYKSTLTDFLKSYSGDKKKK